MTTPAEPICIVDDDKSVLRALSRLLLSNGLQARSFFSPVEFIEYTKTHEVPVVILDLNMPEMSGLEVFASLRSMSPRPQVIFLSGTDDASCRVTVIALGAAAFFSKPFIDDSFISSVHAALAA